MIDVNFLNKVINKIKKTINIGKFDDSQSFIDTNDKFPKLILWYYVNEVLKMVINCINDYFYKFHYCHKNWCGWCNVSKSWWEVVKSWRKVIKFSGTC